MVLPAVQRAATAGETLFQKQSALRAENSRPALRFEKISAGVSMAKGKTINKQLPASGVLKTSPAFKHSTFDLRNPRSMFLVSMLLFVFVAWVFLPSLQGGFLYFDENAYVTGNPHVNSGLSWMNILWAFGSLNYANWHPLTWLSHMMDVQFYGLNPWGHHLTSVLLHALNTVLVFLVFR